ncbi:hypothetical protein EVAR_861_1 [Eumeta japonica]|uniref:Uncharacterized protein n=1 Tax=Eumeta variegata TaxID=151549 RepID=A0A4C1SDU0_EUMVA|nr:hypothetical protein EVAR_861_1 [Eumeta japonica]
MGQILSTCNQQVCKKRLMDVSEARKICKDRTMRKSVVSVYPYEKYVVYLAYVSVLACLPGPVYGNLLSSGGKPLASPTARQQQQLALAARRIPPEIPKRTSSITLNVESPVSLRRAECVGMTVATACSAVVRGGSLSSVQSSSSSSSQEHRHHYHTPYHQQHQRPVPPPPEQHIHVTEHYQQHHRTSSASGPPVYDAVVTNAVWKDKSMRTCPPTTRRRRHRPRTRTSLAAGRRPLTITH